jgi:thiol-disulfide isomerase/thioredoxin
VPLRPRSSAALLAVLCATALVAGCSASTETGVGTTGSGEAAADGPGYISGSGTLTTVALEERGAPAEVRGETLEGDGLDLADFRGDVVVLNFWASWCPPCRAEAGNLQRAYEASQAAGVEFVGVNVKDKRANAISFERAQGTTYPSIYDQPGAVALRFRGLLPPDALPSTLVLDREGRVAARFLGGVTEAQLQTVIDDVVAESAGDRA